MHNIYSIILAARQSNRMGSLHTNKVCLKLQDKPVICHAVEAIEKAGINSHTVVIGAGAADVLTVLNGQYSNIAYAYQPQQFGSADALRCAISSLPQTLNKDILLLITPGHRIVRESVLNDLLELYQQGSFKMVGAELVDAEVISVIFRLPAYE